MEDNAFIEFLTKIFIFYSRKLLKVTSGVHMVGNPPSPITIKENLLTLTAVISEHTELIQTYDTPNPSRIYWTSLLCGPISRILLHLWIIQLLTGRSLVQYKPTKWDVSLVESGVIVNNERIKIFLICAKALPKKGLYPKKGLNFKSFQHKI